MNKADDSINAVETVEIVIEGDATLRMIYSELIDPRSLGKPTITRGSHVEPLIDASWAADMSPVGGPLLGPFASRRQALNAEVRWLKDHWLGLPCRCSGEAIHIS